MRLFTRMKAHAMYKARNIQTEKRDAFRMAYEIAIIDIITRDS